MATPATERGFVVGKQYKLLAGNDEGWPAGTVVTFKEDDGSSCPKFTVPTELDRDGYRFLYLRDLESVDTKPKGLSFNVSVGDGKTDISIGKELTAEQVGEILDAAGIK